MCVLPYPSVLVTPPSDTRPMVPQCVVLFCVRGYEMAYLCKKIDVLLVKRQCKNCCE